MAGNALTELGLTGRDIIHIPLLVFPKPKLEGGAWVESIGIAFVHGTGELHTSHKVDYIFYLVDQDGNVPTNLEFADIEVGGTAWPGIYVYPARGVSVQYGESRKVVVMKNELTQDWYRHPFSIAIRNTDTGELYELDPGTDSNGTPGLP